MKQNLNFVWIWFINFQLLKLQIGSNLYTGKFVYSSVGLFVYVFFSNFSAPWSKQRWNKIIEISDPSTYIPLYIKTLQAGFHHSSRLTGTFWRVWTFNLCWQNWVSKTFSGSKRSTKINAGFSCSKKRAWEQEYGISILTWIVTIKGIDSV